MTDVTVSGQQALQWGTSNYPLQVEVAAWVRLKGKWSSGSPSCLSKNTILPQGIQQDTFWVPFGSAREKNQLFPFKLFLPRTAKRYSTRSKCLEYQKTSTRRGYALCYRNKHFVTNSQPECGHVSSAMAISDQCFAIIAMEFHFYKISEHLKQTNK